jgi:hypothetical protein
VSKSGSTSDVLFTTREAAQRLAEQIIQEAQREPDLLVTLGDKQERYVFVRIDEAGQKVYAKYVPPPVDGHS